jgi:hypothetical protein
LATPWAIQLLTPDYLIYGFIDSEASDRYYTLTSAETSSTPSTCVVHLTQATFRPASNLVPIDPSPTEWYSVGWNAFLAVMPWDQASVDYLVKESSHKSLIPADIYIGPYLIQGKVWSRNKSGTDLSFLAYAHRFIVQDVCINCLLPGSQLHDLKAPFAVLRTHLLQSAAVRA